MNNYLETKAKELFCQVKVRYILLNFFLLPFGLVFLCIIFLLIISLLYPPFGSLVFSEDTWMERFIEENIFFITMTSYIMIFTCICWQILRKMESQKINLKHILGGFFLKKRLWLSVFIVILAVRVLSGGVIQITLFFASLISQDFAKNAVETANESFIYNGENFFLQISYWLLFFITIVVIAPITEEFIFRGAILHRWATKWGIVTGILMSSFLFGIFHVNIFFISISISGFVYALLYIKTGSLLVPIIAHALHNFLVFVNYFFENVLSTTNGNEEITIVVLWYGIVNISMAIPALIYFLKIPKNIAALPYFANQKKLILNSSRTDSLNKLTLTD